MLFVRFLRDGKFVIPGDDATFAEAIMTDLNAPLWHRPSESDCDVPPRDASAC
jgi:hypothetical protein